MKIRMANDDDRDGICKLADEINMEHFNHMPRYFAKPKADRSDWWYWQSTFQKEDRFMLVCIMDETVVGFVSASIVDTPDLPFLVSMKRCLIGTIVVASHYQRKGIASQLVARVCEVAKEKGAIDLGLEVMDFNRGAREFYRKLGFGCFSERLSKSLD
ncbi:GNAT family N-acetyltransferase [Celerinatantimonas yamalensis]|uniref:GNAT family N-acetyltransferase n=1 Tax=Celerinatantimonas yamalensis TaxID=559956 RepID=A0ABW9G7N7_9GAMM